jgi:hypothetical protein
MIWLNAARHLIYQASASVPHFFKRGFEKRGDDCSRKSGQERDENSQAAAK